MIRVYQAIQCTWFIKGKQRKIPTYDQYRGVKLIGVLNYETSEVICTEEEKYDAMSFLEFLRKVLLHYPSGKIIIILDNARIHHVKLLCPFLEENKDRLELMFLPPYSPELNCSEVRKKKITVVFLTAILKRTGRDRIKDISFKNIEAGG